jgi:Tol biopolymer transport system component
VDPEWSPEGDRVFFALGEVGSDIRAVPADGSAEPTSVTKGFEPSLSRDGRFLVFSADERGRRMLRYAAIGADGSVGRPTPLGPQAGSASIDQGRVSPDGRLLAYVADESGRQEVFLTTFPQGRGRWQVSVGGGRAPRWARDTGELFFAAGTGAQGPRIVMAVDVRSEPKVTVGRPEAIVDLRASGAESSSWDVSPDGKRILAVRAITAASDAAGIASPETVLGGVPRITVIQNWLAEFESPR